MRAIRAVLIVIGVAVGLNGLWLMRDFDFDQLRSIVIFLAAGLVIHDGILAPLTIAVCFVASRVLPAATQKPAAIALVVWGTITVVALTVLSRMGGKPDNDTILNRPYWAAWLILTAVVLAATVAATLIRPHRSRP
ncbi:MAG: hypothetical protein JWP10_2030 [Nocardioidaceae bacterium]|nr:hypothetical protein [Nocardioidaceae bacterium]